MRPLTLKTMIDDVIPVPTGGSWSENNLNKVIYKGPVTRSDIRKRSNQIMKEKNILRVSFAYLIV